MPADTDCSQALAAKYQRDLLSESDLLLRAELWTQSHAVIANELAPDVVLANDMSALRTLFANIVPYHTKVGNWQNGGKVGIPSQSCDSNDMGN